MRLLFLKDYRDRYGVEHKTGDAAELPDLIGAKLLAYKIAVAVSAPEVAPEPEVTEAAPEVAEAPVVKRGPGRPRKNP